MGRSGPFRDGSSDLSGFYMKEIGGQGAGFGIGRGEVVECWPGDERCLFEGMFDRADDVEPGALPGEERRQIGRAHV